jgi:hypothetical protein
MLCIKNREDREKGSQGLQMRKHAVIPIAAVKEKAACVNTGWNAKANGDLLVSL